MDLTDKDSLKIDTNEIKENISESFDVTFDLTPIKAESDKNEYLVMKLSNGLTALLISDVENLIDPLEVIHDEDSENSGSYMADIYSTYSMDTSRSSTSDKSAMEENSYKGQTFASCALTIGMGSFQDPETIPGLSHFVEHMLFMGSEKFPENDFDSYITTKGGSTNAYTDCEITTFQFTCPDKHLYNAMDHFSSYFISPLMKMQSMKKVRECIEEEFQTNTFKDSFRREQIIFNTASLDNPIHKFKWGNPITLQQNFAEKELYNTMKEFWNTHYSPKLMTLAVHARWPLDVLGIWVAQFFGEIPLNDNHAVQIQIHQDPPFKKELFNKIYTIMPMQNANFLHLTWAFPSLMHLYKSKPLSLLSFLIHNKGEGSLFSNFQKEFWVLDIHAQSSNDGYQNNSVFSLFSINIELTEEGLNNFERIIEQVFSYIKLLKDKGLPESIFKECLIINEIKFRFKHEIENTNYTERLSQNMQQYPPLDYIAGDKLLFEYQPQKIMKILQLMTPENVNIMILSKSEADKVKLNYTEPWFRTKYTLKEIPSKLLLKWQHCETDPKYFLPKPNKYIPNNFIIERIMNPPEYPNNIIKTELIEVWHKPDGKFKLPYSYIKIYLISPIASSLPQNSVMCDIFISVFDYLIIKETYAANLTGLHCSLSQGDNGLILTITGFNDKTIFLLKTILKKMIVFARSKNIAQDIFLAMKNQQRKEYYNTALDASKLITELNLSILSTNCWDSLKKLEVINDITIEKFKEYNVNFFENLYIKCLIQGNISEKNAIDISDKIISTLDSKPLLRGTHPKTRTHVIPLGEKIIRVQSKNTENMISIVTNYYQCGLNNIADNIKIELLMLIMYEPLYETLRNHEKVVYDVCCNTNDKQGVLGFTITAKFQADKFSVEYVEERIKLFLKKFKTELENLTPSNFDQAKEILKKLKQEEVKTLKDDFRKNWSEIVSDEYMFNRLKREIISIDKTKLTDLNRYICKILGNIDEEEFYDKMNCSRKLSVQIESEKHIKDDNNEVRENDNVSETKQLKSSSDITTTIDKKLKHKFIKDIEKFKSSMFLFPYYNYNVIPDM